MKKQLRKIVCSIISAAMMLSGTSALAADVNTSVDMQMTWFSDYSDSTAPELTVEFTPVSQYNQQITAVVYPASVTSPVLSDYVQINEITVLKGQKTKVTLNILDTYTATDGKYTVKLASSGYLRGEDTIEVDVIKPSAIPGLLNEFSNATSAIEVDVIKPSAIPGLLNEFSNATSATFAGVLDKVIPALQLEAEPDASRETKRINIMFNIQANDYNGEFSNLENIRDAWKVSDIIAYITDGDKTAQGLKSRIESNSDLLGINTADAVYVAYIDSVCQDILDYSSEYNNGAGVLCTKDLKEIINQYIGLKRINSADENDLYGIFDIYKSYFGIPADKLAIYNGYQSKNQTENCDLVLRALYQKNFTKNSELVTAFVNSVNSVENQISGNGNPPVIIVPQGGGNSGTSTVPGAVSAPTAAPTPPTTPGFKDVPASHWAYPYVTELAKKNIIGGYDDGTFGPGNNVTREEFVKMIIGAAGMLSLDKECDFEDVAKGAWYYDYIASACAAGVVNGIDDESFGIGRNITRQDVAVIAARVLEYLGADTTVAGETTLTDFDTVSDYAQDSVKLLNGKGIINGFDDGSFMPHNALTRAEAATIICRLINSI